MVWTKSAALKQLEESADETRVLQSQRRQSEAHIRWLAKTKRCLEEIFGVDSDYYHTFTSLAWKKRGSFVIGGPARPAESFNPQLGIERVNQEAYEQDLEMARGLLLAAKDELKDRDLSDVYRGKKDPAQEPPPSTRLPKTQQKQIWYLKFGKELIAAVIVGVIVAIVLALLGLS